MSNKGNYLTIMIPGAFKFAGTVFLGESWHETCPVRPFMKNIVLEKLND
jgi:hypothetical protein